MLSDFQSLLEYCTQDLGTFFMSALLLSGLGTAFLKAWYIFFSLSFSCCSRFFRHLNIRSKGWPPEYLDADGDFKPKPDTLSSTD